MSHNEATKIIAANTSPRFKRLEELERWVRGAQYEGRPSWWDDKVPLWDRAPCIVYRSAKMAIDSNADLCLGEGRFPAFTTSPDEDDDDEDGLVGTASEVVDKFIRKYHKASRFRSHARAAFKAAQRCGTAVAIHGTRNRRPFNDLIPAQWCEPQFDNDRNVTSLEIRYPFLDWAKDASGQWQCTVKLYRRTIDAEFDVTYQPAVARGDGIEPSWRPDPALSFAHTLGFCPVIWYPFMVESSVVNVIDGEAIHCGLFDEIQAHDIAVSQRHRGALLSEPQLWESGVQKGYNPTGTGVTPGVAATHDGHDLAPGELPTARYLMDRAGGDPARKKGPGYVYQYESVEAKLNAIFYPGDALKAQDDNARDLKIKLQEELCVVFLDPENLKAMSNMSGRTLRALKQRQLDRCDQLRDDLDECFLQPSISMQLRIAQKLGPAGINVPGIKKAAPVLAKFNSDAVASA